VPLNAIEVLRDDRTTASRGERDRGGPPLRNAMNEVPAPRRRRRLRSNWIAPPRKGIKGVRSSREGGRVMRWGHRVPEKLGLEGERQAVLAELLLRGAQTLGELRTRASRMTPLATTDEVREILGALAERGFVAELPRRPGERGQRWTHLLGTEPEEVLPRPATAIEPPEAPPPAPPPAPTPGVLPTPEPAASEADRLTALEEEVRLLREEVESLRRAMTELP
jgi:uncharacterized protein YceH (UPF0502 family)